jgi:hypothetical protein
MRQINEAPSRSGQNGLYHDPEDLTMPLYSVVDIGENALDSVYPLVRTMAPEVSLEQWLDYARMAQRRGGLLGLFGPDGALFGFLAWRKETTLRRGTVLHVDKFVTFELSRAGDGRRALCEAAEALARREKCSAIDLRLGSRGYAGDAADKADGWTSLGHSLGGVIFTKSLAPDRLTA